MRMGEGWERSKCEGNGSSGFYFLHATLVDKDDWTSIDNTEEAEQHGPSTREPSSAGPRICIYELSQGSRFEIHCCSRQCVWGGEFSQLGLTVTL